MTGGALDHRLGRFLVEDARIDRAVVELREREDRRERHAAIAALERTRLQECEDECRNLVGELRVCLAAESRDLGALHRVEQTELRFDHAGTRLVSAEFGRDRLVEVDDVLDAEVADAVNR